MVAEAKKTKDVKKTSSKEEKQREVKPFTKIVVRRLPPRLSKDDFVETVGPLADNDYFHFVAADSSLEPHAFSRAYINFLNSEDVFSFRDKFDGYVFVDDKGNEYQAIVEFSPYQKVPKPNSKSKKDLKSGTIETDPDYLLFVESLDKPDASSIFNPETYLEELETKEKEAKVKEITPLLEFILNKKAEKARMREERLDARRKRDDDRRKAREEERKRKKENAEKNFLEMMNEKTKTEAADEKPKEEKTRTRDSGGRGGGPDKDRNRGERFAKDERSNEKEKERQRRRDEDRQRRREKQREKERERRKETKRNPDKEMSEDKKKEEQTEKKESGQMEAQTDEKKMRTEGQKEEMGKHSEEDEAAKIRRENRARRERIKNKERPAMEIYRPGMGKFSSQTLKPGESKSSRPNSPDEPETEGKQPEAAKRDEKPKRSGNQRDQQQRDDSEATTSGGRSDRGGRRDSGRKKLEDGRKDESAQKDDKSGSKPEKSGSGIPDERKRRPVDKANLKEERPKARDDRGPKNRGKDEKTDSSRNRGGRGERSGNKDGRIQEDRPPKEPDVGKPITPTQKAAEVVQKPVESQAEPTGDDGGKEPERRSGKSYLSKRRERQQEREERAAKEQEE